MSVLSAQSIRKLCNPPDCIPEEFRPKPLITPFVERGVVNGKSYGLSACTYDCRIDQDLTLGPGMTALASTLEEFNFPHNICGHVLDKSTWARVFVSAFNTHFDPGFNGYATIELANLSQEVAFYKRGDPVCQFIFMWLDDPTDLPYVGRKYSNQERGPQGARYE